jgi:ATP-binding cassette, subfamily B, bacterial
MNDLLWPASRLGEALHALVAHAFARAAPALVTAPHDAVQHNPELLSDWLEIAAHSFGVEVQSTETPYPDLERQLSAMGPALIRVPQAAGDVFLALLPGKRLQALGPDLQPHSVSAATVRSLLCGERETALQKEVQQLLDRAGVPPRSQARARDAILRERLSGARISGIWLLRLPSSTDFWRQLKQARVPQRLFLLGGAHALQYGLWILAWWVVGTNVLSRRADQSWMFLWALLLLTLVPLRVFITWLQGLLAIGAGARLKQRLFLGALKLDPDSIRHQGAGQLLGRVLESEAVEALALSGGFLALVALIEVAASVVVLSLGAGGALQAGLLVVWLAAGAAIAWRYYRRNRSWTDVRLRMTHDLVESMVGHRTRLAQLPADRWHQGEDEALESYLKTSKVLDNSTAALLAFVPRGWLVLALVGLGPAFVRGDASTARIAIAVGGMLLAYRALKRCASGAWQVAGAAVAWERVSVLFHAAARKEVTGSLESATAATRGVIDASNLTFRYSEKTPQVLRGCSIRIAPGERVVLEGASGGGKSTLVSLLAGLREPGSGQVLIDGLDLQALGDTSWRKHIAAAPQFHENHVLAETLAFNLMMGRHKIPSPRDFPEAEAICRELGLGELIEQMPAGLLQMVGETGWQLSHGERSRLYIARALLQDADLVVLDESFAALDPMNLQHALACVVKRARSLLVIAHR